MRKYSSLFSLSHFYTRFECVHASLLEGVSVRTVADLSVRRFVGPLDCYAFMVCQNWTNKSVRTTMCLNSPFWRNAENFGIFQKKLFHPYKLIQSVFPNQSRISQFGRIIVQTDLLFLFWLFSSPFLAFFLPFSCLLQPVCFESFYSSSFLLESQARDYSLTYKERVTDLGNDGHNV